MKYRLPTGMQIIPLSNRNDCRGYLVELFRSSWIAERDLQPFIQWNMAYSQAGVLRGVHVHLKHSDYLVVIQGQMLLGLRDMRLNSPTYNLICLRELDIHNPAAIIIPPGVAHGFYFPQNSLHLYGVNEYWDPDDEFGCAWSDADLKIPWPITDVILSDRDKKAPSFKTLIRQIQHFLT